MPLRGQSYAPTSSRIACSLRPQVRDRTSANAAAARGAAAELGVDLGPPGDPQLGRHRAADDVTPCETMANMSQQDAAPQVDANSVAGQSLDHRDRSIGDLHHPEHRGRQVRLSG
jgi:hypothetical protein